VVFGEFGQQRPERLDAGPRKLLVEQLRDARRLELVDHRLHRPDRRRRHRELSEAEAD
jgi:hypothetical protein